MPKETFRLLVSELQVVYGPSCFRSQDGPPAYEGELTHPTQNRQSAVQYLTGEQGHHNGLQTHQH